MKRSSNTIHMDLDIEKIKIQPAQLYNPIRKALILQVFDGTSPGDSNDLLIQGAFDKAGAKKLKQILEKYLKNW